MSQQDQTDGDQGTAPEPEPPPDNSWAKSEWARREDRPDNLRDAERPEE